MTAPGGWATGFTPSYPGRMPKKTHPTDIAMGDHVTLTTPARKFRGTVAGLEPAGVILHEPDVGNATVPWDSISRAEINVHADAHRQTARATVPNSVLPHHLQRDPR